MSVLNKYAVSGLRRIAAKFLINRPVVVYTREGILEMSAVADEFVRMADLGNIDVTKVNDDLSRVEIGYTISDEIRDTPIGGARFLVVWVAGYGDHTVTVARIDGDSYTVTFERGDTLAV